MPTTEDKVNKPTAKPRKPETASASNVPPVAAMARLDFDDLKPQWEEILTKRRPSSERKLFEINTRLKKIDPIAEQALAALEEAFDVDDDALRTLINQRGWATEVDRITKRINRLRLSDVKQHVLAKTYTYVLYDLLQAVENDEEVEDDLGFAEAILFELRRENGPLDRFALAIVKLISEKNRIDLSEDDILADLLVEQVRASF